MITLRPATRRDVPAVLTMAVRFIAESSYRGQVTPDCTAIAATVLTLIGDHFLRLAVSAVDVPVGMLGAMAYTHPLTGHVTVSEIAWWVEPEYRASRVGIRLLEALEHWARIQQAAAIHLLAPAGAPPSLHALYARRGYAALETTYQRRLAA